MKQGGLKVVQMKKLRVAFGVLISSSIDNTIGYW